MTPTEKAIIKSLSDLTRLICEIGDTQAKIADYISERLPDADTKALSDASKTTRLELQSLKQQAESLKAAVK